MFDVKLGTSPCIVNLTTLTNTYFECTTTEQNIGD